MLIFGGNIIFIIMGVRYRETWEKLHGPIPYDEYGRPFDIHHIDGNRKNNDISNLICLSIEDHYKLHLRQSENGNHKDLAAVRLLEYRLYKSVKSSKGWTLTELTKEKIRQKLKGKKRPKDVVEKVANSLKGHVWTEEQIKKRSDGIKKFYVNSTDEWKKSRGKKISESKKGKSMKEQTKHKLSKINSKLSDNQVLEIMDLIIKGEKYKIISQKYKISQSQITSIKQKKTYKWLWT